MRKSYATGASGTINGPTSKSLKVIDAMTNYAHFIYHRTYRGVQQTTNVRHFAISVARLREWCVAHIVVA